jgi:ribosomal protein S18 acetylase RimI-like enzyme
VGRVGTVVPIVDAPAEALRLLDEWRRALDEGDPMVRAWVRPGVLALADGVREGTVTGGLWVGPKDEAIGIATWQIPAEVGIATGPFLAAGYRHPAPLAAFVSALERLQPVRIVYEPIPGLDSPAIGRALGPLGYTPVQRVDMRFPADAPLPALPLDPEGPIRPLRMADEGAIGDLLARGYADAPRERRLFARYQDPQVEGLDGARQLLHGEVGTWRPDASFAVEVDGRLVALTLVNELQGPLVSEVVTDPAYRRRGFAAQLLRSSVGAVRALGLGVPRLVVTVGNDRAQRVYRAFGFVEDPSTLGTLWMKDRPA